QFRQLCFVLIIPHMPNRVAFIGLGVMGEPMAGHLLAGGNTLTVHTRTATKAKALVSRGATYANSPAEAASGAEVTFLCVPDTPDVRAVTHGERGLIHGVRTGSIVVDHSTISPSATREIAAEFAKKNVAFLDAPISGGDVGARNATLSIMVGGDEAAFAKVESLLQLMGKSITY